MIYKRQMLILASWLYVICMLASCKNVEDSEESIDVDESQSVFVVTEKNEENPVEKPAKDSIVITYDVNHDSFFMARIYIIMN